MGRRRRIWLAAAAGVALVLLVLATAGPPRPTPLPPGSFAFAALGDAPYYPWEDLQYRLVLASLDAHDLAWVLHVGDIFWRPCSDAMYARRLGWFSGLRHPVVYTPGDNEWLDCWQQGSGGFVAQDRLDRVRQVFFQDADRSLGQRTLFLVRQGGREPFPEFVENVRLSHQGLVLATVNLVGNPEGVSAPDQLAEAARAARRRAEAASAWLRETFAEAAAKSASGVVVAFHGYPYFEEPVGASDREPYEPFLATLEEEVERFSRPVLAVHGDFHEYTVDQPLVRRTTGRRLTNFTRLEVPGSPQVGWVRVVVTPGREARFAFESHVVPRWKYW